jgi:SAM-dependent methyltransferase
MNSTDLLKLYHTNPAGGDSEYWDKAWSHSDPYPTMQALESDPLVPFFRRYLSRAHDNLEGGCGPAHWVRYWHDQGYPMVGLDFAARTVARAKAAYPGIRLEVGDVSRLPFEDGTFGSYYSGGVVEHFEGGPEGALREARRVLRPDGVLMISVPDLTPLRRWRYPRSAGSLRRGFDWRWVSDHCMEAPPEPNETFYQYVYPEPRFRDLLESAGFRVLESHGIFILHGLLFEGLLPRFLQGQPARANGVDSQPLMPPGLPCTSAGPPREGALKVLAKRFLIQEDASGVLCPLAPVLRCCKYLFANMRLYICRPVVTPAGAKR